MNDTTKDEPMFRHRIYKFLAKRNPEIQQYPVVLKKLKDFLTIWNEYPKQGFSFQETFQQLYSILEKIKCDDSCSKMESKLDQDLEILLSDYAINSSPGVKRFVSKIIKIQPDSIQYVNREDFFDSYIHRLKTNYSLCNGFMIRWYCDYGKRKRIFDMPSDQMERFDQMIHDAHIRFILVAIAIYNKNTCSKKKINAQENHFNVLLIDKHKSQAELFEPHGRYQYDAKHIEYDRKQLDSELEKFLKHYHITYISPEEYCPFFSFQMFENHEKEDEKDYKNGFCIAWCMMWIDIRIRYPDMDRGKLLRELMKEMSSNQRGFKNFIQGYVSMIHDFMMEDLNDLENILLFDLTSMLPNDQRYILLPVEKIENNHIYVDFKWNGTIYPYDFKIGDTEFFALYNPKTDRFDLITSRKSNKSLSFILTDSNTSDFEPEELYFLLSPLDKKNIYRKLIRN